MRKSIQLMTVVLLLAFACQYSKPAKEKGESQLGVLNHQFNISAAAEDGFNKGLLLLHSFEYVDSREAFQDALKADPNEIMAIWGETMTHYRALWGLQDVDAGQAVLAKLAATPQERLALATDELEKDFLMGVEILFGDGEFLERNQQYATHMAGLYEKYPSNQEVAAFYALGLMWSVDGRDAEVFDLSANVAAGILAENPNHPGALHYMIHANDDPDYAKLSKLAADKYSKVAPDATHALHMPSHIYLALGMWNDMVASNEQSYQASLNRIERKGLSMAARGHHSYAWLHYGYLQQGRFDKAASLLKDMQGFATEYPNRQAKTYLIIMQNAQKVESGTWPENFEPMYVDYENLNLNSKAIQHFTKALFAYEKGDIASINQEIATLTAKVDAAALIVTEGGVALCSAGPTRYAPNKRDIVRANVMIHQMHALTSLLNEKEALAEEHMIMATNLENEAEYSYGPPEIPYPSFEQYGDWLLANDRPEEALAQFNRSLQSAQNRSKALKGKLKALMMLDRIEEAKAVEQVLAGFWQKDLVAMN